MLRIKAACAIVASVFRKRLPSSARKFLRRKKAEIRRKFLSTEETESKVRDLVREIFKRYTGKSVELTS